MTHRPAARNDPTLADMGQIDQHRSAHPPQRPTRGRQDVAREALPRGSSLALVVDIDDLRMNLGQWATRQESRLLARELGIALVDCHLSAGHEVIVPMFLGRLPFIERLAAAAHRHGVAFIEVLLAVDQPITADRFRTRRQELRALSALHPEQDVDDDSVDAIITDALVRLTDIAAKRPGVKTVPAVTDLNETYQLLLATLDSPTS